MDPLSDVLSLLKPQSYVSGGFSVRGDIAIQFPAHRGIKCYSMLAGECWLVMDGVPEPVRVKTSDCFLLPRGFGFCLATSLTVEPVHYSVARERHDMNKEVSDQPGAPYIAGGHFLLTGSHAEMLLGALPPIVHIRRESDKAAMRWSLERMREELADPQPGASLIAQQLAYMMLVQALRLHLADAAGRGVGWLFALADPRMAAALAAVHDTPGDPWTLQSLAERVGMSRSAFALKFKASVGLTPMDYLTRWRMFLAADRLHSAADSLASIASSLGYESESAFGKAFRRVMGCSPRRYKRPAPPVPAPAAHTTTPQVQVVQ